MTPADALRQQRDELRAMLEVSNRQRDAARAEVERLRREYDVRAVIERCPQHDAPTLVDGYQKGRVRIVCSECCDEDNERLREVLLEHERKLVEIWGKEENPYAVAYGWVKPMRDAALAGAPSETRREQDRAIAERVREACASIRWQDEEDGRPVPVLHPEQADAVRALDLDALLGEL